MKNKLLIIPLIGILAVGGLVPAFWLSGRSPETVVYPKGSAGTFFEDNGGIRPASNPAGQARLAAVTLAEAPVHAPVPAKEALAAEPARPEVKPHVVYPYRALMTPTSSVASVAPFVNRLSVPEVWSSASDNPDVRPVIAVVDTGFDLVHEDLVDRFTTGTQAGWDFVEDDNDPMAGTSQPYSSAVSHGTAMAGLVALMDPTALIMPLQALDDSGSGTTDTVAAAIRYAADHGADVISLSLGSDFDDPYMRQEINYAIGKGALVVAAAGNDGCNCMAYPAAYPEVLAVGASDAAGNRASFSSYGAALDVLAPGTAGDVCSNYYNPSNPQTGITCAYSGTSLSAPIVAGLAGLLLNQDPGYSPADLTRFILISATKKPAMSGLERTDGYGYGVVAPYSSFLTASLADPTGQFINVSSSNLVQVVEGMLPLETACQGGANTTCWVELTGPNSTSVVLGTYQIDEEGNASVVWNSATVGLSPGAWQVSVRSSESGQIEDATIIFSVSFLSSKFYVNERVVI